MVLVASIRLAMNIMQEVMFSARSVAVLADIAFDEAELVGQDEGLAVLAQRCPPVLVQRMDRHGEEAELHEASRSRAGVRANRRLDAVALPIRINIYMTLGIRFSNGLKSRSGRSGPSSRSARKARSPARRSAKTPRSPAFPSTWRRPSARSGCKLFERSAAGVKPTPAGQRYYKRCIEAVGQLANASEEVRGFASRVTRRPPHRADPDADPLRARAGARAVRVATIRTCASISSRATAAGSPTWC